MENFTPVSALIGGALIGLAAVALMAGMGRIAGISGIMGGMIERGDTAGRLWRLAFLLGIFSGPVLTALVLGPPEIAFPTTTPMLIVGGFLVGFGTRLGSGCTSGHGVCGISRLSARGIVATATFMATGIITVALVRHVFGGAV